MTEEKVQEKGNAPWTVAVAEAEELLRSYDAMLGGQGNAEGAPVVVSSVQAQKTLHSAQHMLEPLLASPASLPGEEEQKQVKKLLARAYDKEAVLLRQLSKSSEGNLQHRFLFLHQSSVVFEKVLALTEGEDVEALNFLAVNSISLACMIKPSPDQDQYFQKAYDSYKKVCDMTEGKADQKDAHLLAVGNWANALEEQAERKKGKEADAIFDRSIDKYKEYVRKAAPRRASKILLGMAVAMQARGKNLEADGDAGQAKRIDRFYTAAAENYIDIIHHKKAKYNNRYVPAQTLIGAINNYTMVLMNQARLRALYESHFAPFPESCLSLLRECKKVIHAVLLESKDELAGGFADMLSQRMEEVDAFETMITFKSRMADAQQHTAGM